MYQKCPICGGTGLVSKPPWIAGDQDSWICSGSGPYVCGTCSGTGLLWIDAQFCDFLPELSMFQEGKFLMFPHELKIVEEIYYG